MTLQRKKNNKHFLFKKKSVKYEKHCFLFVLQKNVVTSRGKIFDRKKNPLNQLNQRYGNLKCVHKVLVLLCRIKAGTVLNIFNQK